MSGLMAAVFLIVSAGSAAAREPGTSQPDDHLVSPPVPGIREMRLDTNDRVLLRDDRVIGVRRVPLATSPVLQYVAGNDVRVVPAERLGRADARPFDGGRFTVSRLVGGHASAVHPVDVEGQVRVTLLDRNGDPAAPPNADSGLNQAYFFNLDTFGFGGSAADGQAVALPAGRYLVAAAVHTTDSSTFGSRTMIVHPELTVTGDAAVTLDARWGKRISVSVSAATVEREGTAGVSVTDSSNPRMRVDFGLPLDRYDQVYAASVPGVSNDRMTYYHRELLQEPSLRLAVTAPEEFPVLVHSYADLSPNVPRLIGTHDLEVAHGGSGTPAELAAARVRNRLVVLALTPGDSEDPQLVAERIANVAAAGGRAVLFVGPAPYVVESPIPLAYGVDPALYRLDQLSRSDTPSVTWQESAASPYRYDVALGGSGRIPDMQSHVLADEELAAVRNTYHAQGTDGIGLALAIASYDGFEVATGSLVPWPYSRLDRLTPGRWQSALSNFRMGLDILYGPPVTLAEGAQSSAEWNRAVLGPVPPHQPVDGPAKAFRQADRIELALPMLSDASGNNRIPLEVDVPNAAVRGHTELYRDDALVGRVESPGFASFDVPADDSQYRLTSRVERVSSMWTTSTTVAATWTFRSAATAVPTPLPLLGVRAAADVDYYGRGVAGPVRLPLQLWRAGTAAPVPARSVVVQVSTDDGVTWRDVPALPTGGDGWVATYTNPAAGFVSLRVVASDLAGNSVEEVITRAYAIR